MPTRDKNSLIKSQFWEYGGGLTSNLPKVTNKKALIVGYINNRLTQFPGFFAKTAYFGKNKLIFEGSLPEKRATVK